MAVKHAKQGGGGASQRFFAAVQGALGACNILCHAGKREDRAWLVPAWQCVQQGRLSTAFRAAVTRKVQPGKPMQCCIHTKLLCQAQRSTACPAGRTSHVCPFRWWSRPVREMMQHSMRSSSLAAATVAFLLGVLVIYSGWRGEGLGAGE